MIFKTTEGDMSQRLLTFNGLVTETHCVGNKLHERDRIRSETSALLRLINRSYIFCKIKPNSLASVRPPSRSELSYYRSRVPTAIKESRLSDPSYRKPSKIATCQTSPFPSFSFRLSCFICHFTWVLSGIPRQKHLSIFTP